MDFEEYKIAFTKEASNSGFSAISIQHCLDYAEVLLNNNVPIIYNTSHFSALVGYKKEYLKRAVIYTKSFYRNFVISKRNGNPRIISEPLPSLKEIQNWILENILINVPVNPFAKAYRKNVSLIENIRFHKNQPMVFAIDIENFFSSIRLEGIEEIFQSLGYSALISNLLSKLCTKDGVLPQGAPTSPYLSNLFFKKVDDVIVKYCLDLDIKYTRYADDLTFSGDFNSYNLYDYVKKSVKTLGLTINENKTGLMLPNNRQIVTGIIVNEKPQVPFNTRNSLRQDLYYIKKFGIESHMKHKKIRYTNYLEHLLGKINFILQINPSDKEFQSYKMYLLGLKFDKDGIDKNISQ